MNTLLGPLKVSFLLFKLQTGIIVGIDQDKDYDKVSQ